MMVSNQNRLKGIGEEAKGRAKQTLSYANRSNRLMREEQAEAMRGRAGQEAGKIEGDRENTED